MTPCDLIDIYENSKTGKAFYAGEILKRDEEKHEIHYTNNGEKVKASLHKNLQDRLTTETNRILVYIENGYEKRYSNENEKKAFTSYLINGFKKLKSLPTYSEFHFICFYFNKIFDSISTFRQKQ